MKQLFESAYIKTNNQTGLKNLNNFMNKFLTKGIGISFEFAKTYLKRVKSLKNFIHSVDLQFIDKYNYLNWDWDFLSIQTYITTEFIDKYIDKSWNWNVLSKKFPEKNYDKYIQKT
jgi:hypothetical protein